jgi:hypothetical protein
VAHHVNNGLTTAMLAIGELQELAEPDAQPSALATDAQHAITKIRDWNRRFFDLGGTRLLGEVRELDLAQSLRSSFAMARRHTSMRRPRSSSTFPPWPRSGAPRPSSSGPC